MSARTCPDWPELMELDPDLQFKHYTVAEAQLPAEALSRISHVVARRGRDLLRPRAPRLQPRPHRSRRGRGAARHALVRRPRVGDVRPRRERLVLERRLTTLRRVPAIVIPYRGDAKRRLPSSLRAAVAVAMLGDVVEAALAVGRVLVVTDDPSVVPARRRGRRRSRRGPRGGRRRRSRTRRRPRARRQRRSPGRDAGRAPAARGRRPRARRGARTERRTRSRCPTRASSRRSTARAAPSASARTRRSRPSRSPSSRSTSTPTPISSASRARLGPRTRALLAVPA